MEGLPQRPACYPIYLTATLLSSLLTAGPLAHGAVFPSPLIPENGDIGSWRYNGVKRALYYVVHDQNDPFSPSEWDARVNLIRSTETATRRFFAANSGGKFDIYYDPVIVEAAITLNPDGTRPNNWRSQADAIATSQGLNLSDYFMYAYDVDDTQPTPGQGWGGLSSGDAIYLQSPGVKLNNHEIGHRISLGHARAITPRNDATYHTYVWDATSESYVDYIPGVSPFHPTPFGAPRFEYGNPFDTMGNVSDGQVSVEKKYDIGWLDDTNVPSLTGPGGLGEGTFRIYAHDELQHTIGDDTVYGVAEGYNDSVYYGLIFERTGEEYDPISNQFQMENQRVFIEYRSGEDGLAFYLDRDSSNHNDDAELVDLDPVGVASYGNRDRLLTVGNGIEDPDFGLSNFTVNAGIINQNPSGIDFLLDFNPVPPSDPTALRPEWFHFLVTGSGSDSIGSYMEVDVSIVSPLSGIAGDLDQNGVVNQTDLDLFLTGWRTDTSALPVNEKYAAGDMNLDGITDLVDLDLFRDVLVGLDDDAIRIVDVVLPVPEPSGMMTCLLFLTVCQMLSRNSRSLQL